MKKIFILSAILFCLSNVTSAQLAEPQNFTQTKKLGIRLHKEPEGTGLSGMIEIPISRNGKWTLTNTLGITIAHPYYNWFSSGDPTRRGSSWKNTEKPKRIDFSLNYPIGVMYNINMKWYANTHKKWSTVLGFGYFLYLSEFADGMDTDNYYTKEIGLLYGIAPNFWLGVAYRPAPKWQISLDANASVVKATVYENNKWRSTDNTGPWPNVGINVLWNWK